MHQEIIQNLFGQLLIVPTCADTSTRMANDAASIAIWEKVKVHS